jgi:hypothetical protein
MVDPQLACVAHSLALLLNRESRDKVPRHCLCARWLKVP